MRTTLVCFSLIAAIVAVYWRVGGHEFISLDDPYFITRNAYVKAGLSWDGLRWAFYNEHWSWHPITWLSHMADCDMFGVEPRGHHLMNVAFHIANTLILFGVLRMMTGSFWRSAIVAALFALHPLRVEAVAWACERKGLLSTFFGLITLAAYAYYARKPQAGGKKGAGTICAKHPSGRSGKWFLTPFFPLARYALVLIAFAMCLMSKAMLVTLPFALLLLDYWPLRRTGWRRLMIEKIPLLAMSVAVAVITSESVEHVEWPLVRRLGNAVVAYAHYLANFVWPQDLVVPYVQSGAWPMATIVSSVSVLVLLTVIATVLAGRGRRCPQIAVGWFWFGGMLVPVIGLIQSGVQYMSDRFTYVPMIGLMVAVVWTIGDMVQAKPRARSVAVAAAVAVLIACAVRSWFQLEYWKDSRTLYAHAIDVDESNYRAHTLLGGVLLEKGDYEQALKSMQSAVAIEPDAPESLTGLGTALIQLERFGEAVGHLTKAVQIDPKRYGSYVQLGEALYKNGQPDQAVKVYQTAISITPVHPKAHLQLATVFIARGNDPQAIPHLEKVIAVQPLHKHANLMLAKSLGRTGQSQQALPYFARHLHIAPDDPEGHYYTALTLMRLRDEKTAIAHLSHAISLKEDHLPATMLLARVLATLNDDTLRDGPRAVALAERACIMTEYKSAAALDALAAAKAETNDFTAAITHAREAIRLAEQSKNKRLTDQVRIRLSLYESGKPYRHPRPRK